MLVCNLVFVLTLPWVFSAPVPPGFIDQGVTNAVGNDLTSLSVVPSK